MGHNLLDAFSASKKEARARFAVEYKVELRYKYRLTTATEGWDIFQKMNIPNFIDHCNKFVKIKNHYKMENLNHRVENH